jgi:predicted CoA-binding protein
VLWLQLGLSDPGAERIARAGGLTVIADRCLWVEHARLSG